MFESLSDRLNETLGRLGRKGRLTEADIDEAMREVVDAGSNFGVTLASPIPKRACQKRAQYPISYS